MNVHTAGLCRAILAVLSTSMLLLGCSTGVRTPINQTPNSNIYLEWVQQDSFHASHPATLSPTIIRETLRGVRIQEQKSGLGELVSGQQNPKRIFSDEDVKLLLPHILTALSEATPEEHVVFQRLYPWEYGSRMTAGTLSLHEDLLFLTITHYTQKPGGIKFSYVDDRQAPDPTGLRDQTVSFVPKEALRPDKSPQEPRHPLEVTLAINYPLLKTLQEAGEQPAPFPIRQTETPSPAHTREGAVAPINQKTFPPPGESSANDPAFRALEEQVHKQEEELEQLKKELQEIQRSRNSQRQPH